MPDASKDPTPPAAPPEHTFEEPRGDDTKCSGRPGCKSNRISQGHDRWVCDTCRRG